MRVRIVMTCLCFASLGSLEVSGQQAAEGQSAPDPSAERREGGPADGPGELTGSAGAREVDDAQAMPIQPKLPRYQWLDLDLDGRREAILSEPGVGCHVFRYDPVLGFEDVTESVGLGELVDALSTSWHDYDQDGLPDVLLVDAQGGIQLFHNSGGLFEDVTRESGLTDTGARSQGKGLREARWVESAGDDPVSIELRGDERTWIVPSKDRRSFEPGLELPARVPASPSRGPRRLSNPAASPKVSGLPAGTSSSTGPTVAPSGPPSLPPNSPAGSSVCVDSLGDFANPGACLNASSVPTLGLLMPLSVDLFVSSAGKVGMGTTSPAGRLNVVGGSDASHSGGGHAVFGSTLADNIVIDGDEIMARFNGTASSLKLNLDGGDIVLGGTLVTNERITAAADNSGGIGTSTMWSENTSNGNAVALVARGHGTGASAVFDNLGGGDILQGLRNSSVVHRVTNSGQVIAPSIEVTTGINPGGNNVILGGTLVTNNRITAAASNAGGLNTSTLWSENTSTGNAVALMARTHGTGTAAGFDNRGGGDILQGYSTGSLVYRVTNTGRVVTSAVQITGGGDLVEGFESQGDSRPGTVMVIDPDRPGQLKPSVAAYDSKVAGVVSGAGGVHHGLRMGQDGVLDGETLIAMTGRVYVRCSAENGAIQPGDRLTTASIPGHAMKATDSERWDGAVLGKAMTRLDGDEGLVLVLVNLQ